MNHSLNIMRTFSRKTTGKNADYSQNRMIRNIQEKVAFGFIWLAGLFAVAAVIWIVAYVLFQGVQIVNLEFLTTRPAGGMNGEGGMSTTIVTTIYLVILVVSVATPLGVGTAIFLVEYAGDVSRESRLISMVISVVRSGIEILAGVPSIIFGLFGFALFVSAMKFNFSLLSAGLSGACMVLPVIIRASEEALLTVPLSYREGSLGLGATKWQTTWSVVLPAALPGIITGIILSVGRIIAETAIFWVTLGGTYHLPTGLLSGGRTMALHVYMLASETRAFDKAMATAAVLIVVIIAINLIINILSRRITAKATGKR